MPFKITAAKLTGNPTMSGLVQVYDPLLDGASSTRAKLYIVVATKGETQESGANLAKETIDKLQSAYDLNTQRSEFESLAAAVEKVYFELLGQDEYLGLAAVTVINSVLYVAVAGEIRLSLFREGRLISVLKGSRGKSINASGFLQDSDIVVCGTKEFFSFFTSTVLTTALQGNGPKDAVESLAPSIYTGDSGGRIGALFLGINEVVNYAVKPDNKHLLQSTLSPADSIPTGEEKEIKPPEKPQRIIKRQPISHAAVNFLKRNIKVGSQDLHHVSARKRSYAVLGVVFIILLSLSAFVGVRQKHIKDEREVYLSRLNQARHVYEESVSLYQLDPKRSRELFVNSRELVTALEEEGVIDPELNELIGKLAQNEGHVLGEFTGQPELFVNLSLLSSGLSGDTMIATTKRAYVLDKQSRRVVAVSFETKRAEVVAGPAQINGALSLAAFADNVFILQEDGVYSVGREKVKVADNEWTGEVVLASYMSNLYVIEKAAGSIWRYPAVTGGFGNKQNWLLSGVEPDLTNIQSMVIDGSIWLLSGSGQIFKYNSGYQRDFRIQGLFPELNNPSSFYTNEELEYLYVLDNENSRVVVLDKNGEFKYQYLADEAREAKGLAVSEKDKKIILLVGDRLLSIELRH